MFVDTHKCVFCSKVEYKPASGKGPRLLNVACESCQPKLALEPRDGVSKADESKRKS